MSKKKFRSKHDILGIGIEIGFAICVGFILWWYGVSIYPYPAHECSPNSNTQSSHTLMMIGTFKNFFAHNFSLFIRRRRSTRWLHDFSRSVFHPRSEYVRTSNLWLLLRNEKIPCKTRELKTSKWASREHDLSSCALCVLCTVYVGKIRFHYIYSSLFICLLFFGEEQQQVKKRPTSTTTMCCKPMA